MDNMYCVIQYGYGIFGIGLTPDEAIQDAEYWAYQSWLPMEIVGYHSANEGDFYLIECSPDLYALVKEIGGLASFDIIDGVACREVNNG
jgi:hypothetical protein